MYYHYNCDYFIVGDKRVNNDFTPTPRKLLKALRQIGVLPESTKGRVQVDYTLNRITVQKRSGASILELVPDFELIDGRPFHIEPIPLDEFDF